MGDRFVFECDGERLLAVAGGNKDAKRRSCGKRYASVVALKSRTTVYSHESAAIPGAIGDRVIVMEEPGDIKAIKGPTGEVLWAHDGRRVGPAVVVADHVIYLLRSSQRARSGGV
jgi:hypothetical protein